MPDLLRPVHGGGVARSSAERGASDESGVVVVSSVIVGFVDGAIPLVITDHEFLDFRCCISVLPDGGGEDRPLSERTAKCKHRTRFLMGRAPTCPHHIRYAVGLADIRLSWTMEQRIGECAA